MSTIRGQLRDQNVDSRLPPSLDRRFEAVVFDWDGTAVPDRSADASELRALVEELSALGLDLIVVTGTHVGNVDGQLGARPTGPGRLYFCVNRGSEVYAASPEGLELVEGRQATPAEEAALDAAAADTVAELARRGVTAAVVSRRLNRRKIDLIPEPEWADPPKARIGELLAAVQARLRGAGLRGLGDAVEVAFAAARSAGLADPRVTSDAKHVEIGLTDKADAARWAFAELGCRGIGPGLVLIAGDEFGPVGGTTGSDAFLLVPEGARATALSVGAEPNGTPGEVLELGGGPAAFLQLLADQLERRRRGDVPELDGDPDWTIVVEGLDRRLERVHETLLTLADGRLGTRGAPLFDHADTAPGVLFAGAYVGDGSVSELAACPDWTRLCPAPARTPRITRRLDLATGLLREEGRLTSLRFSSLARPATVALRAQANPAVVVSPRRRRAHQAVAAALRDRRHGHVLERLGAYDPEEAVAQAGARRRAGRGLRTAPARTPGSMGAALAGSRRGHRGRSGAPAGGSLRALPPDGVGRRRGRGGRRGARAQRRGLPRPRLLGQRCVRAPLSGGHASGGRAGDARVPRAPSARRARAGANARPVGRPVRLGVGRATAAT